MLARRLLGEYAPRPQPTPRNEGSATCKAVLEKTELELEDILREAIARGDGVTASCATAAREGIWELMASL